MLASRMEPTYCCCTNGAEISGEGIEVERDDGVMAVGSEPGDQTVADLATGTGDENDRFAQHGQIP